MRTLVVSHSDLSGGAARAAYRTHKAVRHYGVDSRMCVNQSVASDWTVMGAQDARAKVLAKARAAIGLWGTRVLSTENRTLHSPAVLHSGLRKRLDTSDVDLLHLHWINGEMLSIADIGCVRKPVVWTLHDMWAFCGAEHYTEDFRWRDGYAAGNRPTYERGFDLNRWTWNRKRKHWKRPMQIVTPSRWLGQCVRESALMNGWPATVIPNPIDTDEWQPVSKVLARKLLQLPPDVPLLLFGAMGGGTDPRKGFDLLQGALKRLSSGIPEMEVVVIGQLAPREPVDLGFPVHYMGHLHDTVSLRLVNSAADVVVVPSRQDNLPQSGTEAQACGCPVVAFNTCGLPDVVAHQETGYLASAFDVDDLAAGIAWVLDDLTRQKRLSKAARERAVRLWSPEAVIPQYLDVYKRVIKAYSASLVKRHE